MVQEDTAIDTGLYTKFIQIQIQSLNHFSWQQHSRKIFKNKNK